MGRVTLQTTQEAATGATVYLPQLRQGTTADGNGNYRLANLPTGNYAVVISLVGYQTERRTVAVRSDSTALSLALKDAISTLNEVVVTGVSRSTEVRKSPVPIAVINKREMEMNVNNNIVDAVLKGVPGLSAVTTGPNISKPFIRGLGYNRVLTLYNGVRQEGQQWGDEHGTEIDQYGVERAEVVKGPASLIYGSDAVAGVINYIPALPKGPEGRVTGDALAEFHTNNGMAGMSVGLGYRKADWKASFRISNKLAHDYRNRVDGLVYQTGYREFNLSALAGVDKRWGSSYVYATLYNNLQEIPDGSRDSLSRRFTKQVFESALDNIKNRPQVSDAELRSYTISPLYQHIQHYRVYTRNRFVIGRSDLNIIAGFQQNTRREFNHPTVPAQAGLFVTLNTINYDVKYNLPTWAGVEATVGVNGMYQANQNKNGTAFPIPNYHLFDIGSFLFLKKSVGALDISGGLRYDVRSWNWRDFYVRTLPETGFEKQAFLPDTAGAALPFPAYQRNFTGISGSLGMTYNLSERLLIKANVSRGYRAPNITEIGSNGLDPGAHIVYIGNRNFKPEFSLQTDLGFIAYLNDLDLSVELFNNSIQNYIYQARLYDAQGQPVVIVPGNFTYQYQQSRAQLYGAEVSLNLHPQGVKWLAFNNSLAYIRGLNRNAELIERNGDLARYLPFIPPLHGRSELRATFDQPVGLFSKTYVRAEVDAYATQDRYYGVDNTETPTPGYALFNVGWGTTVSSASQRELFQFFFQIDNLFDKSYQSHLNRLKYFDYYSASPNGRLGIYNMGRNVSFKVVVPF